MNFRERKQWSWWLRASHRTQRRSLAWEHEIRGFTIRGQAIISSNYSFLNGLRSSVSCSLTHENRKDFKVNNFGRLLEKFSFLVNVTSGSVDSFVAGMADPSASRIEGKRDPHPSAFQPCLQDWPSLHPEPSMLGRLKNVETIGNWIWNLPNLHYIPAASFLMYWFRAELSWFEFSRARQTFLMCCGISSMIPGSQSGGMLALLSGTGLELLWATAKIAIQTVTISTWSCIFQLREEKN